MTLLFQYEFLNYLLLTMRHTISHVNCALNNIFVHRVIHQLIGIIIIIIIIITNDGFLSQ